MKVKTPSTGGYITNEETNIMEVIITYVSKAYNIGYIKNSTSVLNNDGCKQRYTKIMRKELISYD